MKAVKTYLGVKIFKVTEINPYYKETDTGLVRVKSKDIVKTYYKYHESYKYDSIQECIKSIDNILEDCKRLGGITEPKAFAKIMNGEN